MKSELYKERYRFYRKQLRKYKTYKSKIEFLEQTKFLIDMIDRWSEFESVSYEVLGDLIKEVKSWEE